MEQRREEKKSGRYHADTRLGQIEGRLVYMAYFSKIYTANLPHRAKSVYMYLKDRSNQDGQCYPSIGTIAKELNLSRRTVERAINDLILVGFLAKEQRWRENGGRSSLLFTLTEIPHSS